MNRLNLEESLLKRKWEFLNRKVDLLKLLLMKMAFNLANSEDLSSEQISRRSEFASWGCTWDRGDSIGAGRIASPLYSTGISISYSSTVDEACYFPCVQRLPPFILLSFSFSLSLSISPRFLNRNFGTSVRRILSQLNSITNEPAIRPFIEWFLLIAFC